MPPTQISNTAHTYTYALSSAISFGAHPLGELFLGQWVSFCNNLEEFVLFEFVFIIKFGDWIKSS